MTKISLTVSVGLCVFLVFCCCAAADNTIEKTKLEPYNITFNFTGMDEYQLIECDGLERIESYRSSGERMISGWEGTAKLKLAKKSDTKSCIEICISKYNMINPEAIVTKARNYEMIQMRSMGETISQVRQFNERTWYSYREKTDVERPMPTNEIRFEADLVDHYEDVVVTFEYVPDSVIEEFMNSLNITGYGTTIAEETWDQYVARVRKPSDQDPGISPLEFIDRCYTLSNANMRYDKVSGDLYEIWNTGITSVNKTLSKNKIEDLAIKYHYYGPIPLPTNVSIELPNGDYISP